MKFELKPARARRCGRCRRRPEVVGRLCGHCHADDVRRFLEESRKSRIVIK